MPNFSNVANLLSVEVLIYCFVVFIFARHTQVFVKNRWFLPATKSKGEKKFRNEAVSIGLFVFFYMVATEFSRPFFPVFTATFAAQIDYVDKSTLVALPQILWGVFALIGTPLGLWLNRQLGAKNTFILTSIFTTLALASIALSQNYWDMLFYRCVNALCMGVVAVVAVLVLFRDHSVVRLNVFLSAVASGSICANVLGGLCAQKWGYLFAFLISAGIGALSILVVVFSLEILKENKKEAKKLSSKDYAFILSRFRIHLFAALVCTPSRLVLTGFIFYMLPIYLNKLGFNSLIAGQIMMCYFAINYIIVSHISRLLSRTKLFRLSAFLSSLFLALALIVFSMSGAVVLGLIFSMALFSLGMTLGNAIQVPLIPALFQEEIKVVGQERLIAFFRTIERIATVLGPLIASILLRLSAERALQVLSLSLLLFSFITAFWFTTQNKVK